MLNGKVIILTGAAQGIGRATAVEFAKLGVRLVLADINPCDETVGLVNEAGGESIQGIVDVTDFDACEAIVAGAVEAYGQIDGLINIAALYATITLAPFELIPEDEFNACMKVNVTGTWNMCRAVSPVMKEAGRGSIVNISSSTALMGPPMYAGYAASKGAVISLTRTLARELGPANIRVNAVAPTLVATESSKQSLGDQYDDVLVQAATMQCISANPGPDYLAGTLAYLMSDSSHMMTGHTLTIDGGAVFN